MFFSFICSPKALSQGRFLIYQNWPIGQLLLPVNSCSVIASTENQMMTSLPITCDYIFADGDLTLSKSSTANTPVSHFLFDLSTR